MVFEKIECFEIIDHQSPLVSKCLVLMWGKPEFDPFITNLIKSKQCLRGEKFSSELLEALALVKIEHSQQYE